MRFIASYPATVFANNMSIPRIQNCLMPALATSLGMQVAQLLVLAIPVACVAWTVTHEEVFREPREYCQRQQARARSFPRRKFFYVFSCEYCLSHYVAAVFLLITRFQMLYGGWRGYIVAVFALVWVANQYMSVYNRLRLDIKHEHLEIEAKKKEEEEEESEHRTAA
jgi:hypothetical protein